MVHLIKNFSLVFHYAKVSGAYREKLRTFEGNSPATAKQLVVTRFRKSTRDFFLWINRGAEKGVKRKGAAGAYGTKKIWIKPATNRALPYPIPVLFSPPPPRISLLCTGTKCSFHRWELVKNPGGRNPRRLSTSWHLRNGPIDRMVDPRSLPFFLLPLVFFIFHRESIMRETIAICGFLSRRPSRATLSRMFTFAATNIRPRSFGIVKSHFSTGVIPRECRRNVPTRKLRVLSETKEWDWSDGCCEREMRSEFNATGMPSLGGSV